MTENEQKRCKLVERLGVHLEHKDQMAPVAARIYSYIILKGRQGTTFEELMTSLCASKSTISAHLNHLQDLEKIDYFTKIGDRKKYFILNRNAMIKSINTIIGQWEDEKQLHHDIMDHKSDINKTLSTEDQFELKFHQSFITFLNGAISSISELKERIINNNQ
ncbi:MAG: GbsR/MarR family transcriptional regulator [Xanthomarina gelatinilytica]|uniref:GbsR/MarR family transcriptional regulator n=1 Tax=Xanthomarina gelatinilytica TaxID=1137281 RepID=UPI003A88EE5C